MLLFLIITLAATSNCVLSSPLRDDNNNNNNGKIFYDQRQEGEWNVRADLKDFVILIIPTQSASPTTPASPGGATLLDFLSRAIPKRPKFKKVGHLKRKQGNKDPAQETRHFIEAKTAPYHVDISTMRSHLAKLHPDNVVPIDAEEIVIAKSPSIELVKEEAVNNGEREAKALVLTVPQEEIFLTKSGIDDYKKNKIDKRESEKTTTWKLLGAEFEQCGPGLVRDAQGICRTVKN